MSSVNVTEETVNFKWIYNVMWKSAGDIDHFEVKVNANNDSMKTLVHQNATSTKIVLTSQAASIEVAAIDKCKNRVSVLRQREVFEQLNSNNSKSASTFVFIGYKCKLKMLAKSVF